MSSKPETTSDASYTNALRERVRGALLRKNKAEARELLGRLVVLSADLEDRNNLTNLIKGVEEELIRYLRSSGKFRDRLLEGESLESIQSELDDSIPHWRAFAQDLSDLSLAKTGLPPSEDPKFLDRVAQLETRIKSGEVAEVIEEWEEMGAPLGICSSAFGQISELLGKLIKLIEAKDWANANQVHSECRAFLDDEEGGRFQEGVASYLRSAGDLISWERLLTECKEALPEPSAQEKDRLALALYSAIDSIKIRLISADDSSLVELRDRLEKMQRAIENAKVTARKEISGVKWIMLSFFVVFVLLAGLWLYHRLAVSDTELPSSGHRESTHSADR